METISAEAIKMINEINATAGGIEHAPAQSSHSVRPVRPAQAISSNSVSTNVTLEDMRSLLNEFSPDSLSYMPHKAKILGFAFNAGDGQPEWYDLIENWMAGKSGPRGNGPQKTAREWSEWKAKGKPGFNKLPRTLGELRAEIEEAIHGKPAAKPMKLLQASPVTVPVSATTTAKPAAAERVSEKPRRKKITFLPEVQAGGAYKPPEELIQNIIVRGSTNMLFGDSNSGKSALALGMCAAVSNGTDFLGKKTEKGLCIYIAAEAPGSIKARLAALRLSGVSIDNIGVLADPGDLTNGDEDTEEIVESIKEMSAQRNSKVGLIVVDTLARIAPGANENSGQEMSLVMSRIDRIARQAGGTALVIHHTGKDAARGARGWSGLKAHVDTELEVTEVAGGNRAMTITKQRDLDGRYTQMQFKLRVIELGTTNFGDRATSVITEAVEGGATRKLTKSDQALGIVREALRIQNEQTQQTGAYLTRQALRDHMMTRLGYSERTAANKLEPKRGDSIIGLLMSEKLIVSCAQGWTVLAEDGRVDPTP